MLTSQIEHPDFRNGKFIFFSFLQAISLLPRSKSGFQISNPHLRTPQSKPNPDPKYFQKPYKLKKKEWTSCFERKSTHNLVQILLSRKFVEMLPRPIPTFLLYKLFINYHILLFLTYGNFYILSPSSCLSLRSSCFCPWRRPRRFPPLSSQAWQNPPACTATFLQLWKFIKSSS